MSYFDGYYDFLDRVEDLADDLLLASTNLAKRSETAWHSRESPFLLDPEQEYQELVEIENKHEQERWKFREDFYDKAETVLVAKSAYELYLQSEYWQKVKLAVAERSRDRCEACKKISFRLQVHHKWYPSRYTELDHLDALIHLCPACHCRAHQ
jgi:hypothetical protein